MKVVIYMLGFCILIISNSSCSFMCKVPVLETNKSSNWKNCNFCYQYSQIKLKTKSYQYNADSCLITVCPGAKPGSNFLFGPPFVPIIPNPFILLSAKPNAKFFVDMKIENKRGNLTLNLSKIQFQIFNDSLVKPSLIRLITDEHYGEPEEFFNHRKYNDHKYMGFKDSIINGNTVKISTPLIIRFEFSMLTTKVKQFSIRFESIPEIKFKRHSKFVYKPFVFSN